MVKLKLKAKPVKSVVKKVEKASGVDEDMRRYLLPLPEDFPLLKEHFDGEWFQRVDGRSVIQRWKDADGIDHFRLLFYPATKMQESLDQMENDWRTRNDYYLLLWKMLQKFGVADYRRIPMDVSYSDFDKYLNPHKPNKLRLKLKTGKLQLKLKESA